MSLVGLFAVGLFVTLIVSAALGVLIYGAVLDGRNNAQHEADEERRQLLRVVDDRSTAA